MSDTENIMDKINKKIKETLEKIEKKDRTCGCRTNNYKYYI